MGVACINCENAETTAFSVFCAKDLWTTVCRCRTAGGSQLQKPPALPVLHCADPTNSVSECAAPADRHERNKFHNGRGSGGKQAVAGMREHGGKVKAMSKSHTAKPTPQGKISQYVAVGATVCTDDHRRYTGLRGLFHQHKTVRHSAKEYVHGMAHTNRAGSVWVGSKRGYNGIDHNFSNKHPQRGADEVSFRLNEGYCETVTCVRFLLSHYLSLSAVVFSDSCFRFTPVQRLM